MMKFSSYVLGDIDYTPEDVIVFHEGLIGMKDMKQFLLMEKEDFRPFSYLQSLQDSRLSLIVINPLLIRKNYVFKIQEDDFKAIDIRDTNDMSLLSIVVFSGDIKDMTVNLKAPLIINVHHKKGRQVILINENYRVNEPLLEDSTLLAYHNRNSGVKKGLC